MKKQTNNSLRTFIAFTFLILLLTMTACNEKKEPFQNTAVSETRVKAPKIDIHTAMITGNMEALKQHIAAGSTLMKKSIKFVIESIRSRIVRLKLVTAPIWFLIGKTTWTIRLSWLTIVISVH